jgi:hypothetical protein
MILELAPYRSKHCFMPSGKGVERTALLMLERVSRVHVRCALGHSEAVRAVALTIALHILPKVD